LEPFLEIAPVITSDFSALFVLPPNVDLAAYGGNLQFNGDRWTLYPSDRGQLSLYASTDIENAGLRMSDVSGLVVPTPTTSTYDFTTTGTILTNSAPSARHTGDPVPATVIAGRDVSEMVLNLPEAATIEAGRDVFDLLLNLQNTNPGDVSTLSAGRNITYDPTAANTIITVGGGGRFDVVAGSNIDLGFSRGITSLGSLLDPALTTTRGADLTIMAGIAVPLDVSQFVNTVIAPSSSYQAQLINFVEQGTGKEHLTYSQAAAAFERLTPTQQRPLVVSVFFDALVQSGRAANANPAAGFTAGFAAINALFPASNPPAKNSPYVGDLSLAFSRIYTLQGGDINILVPGGSIDVGLANPPPEPELIGLGLNRAPSELGIVAEQAGNVNVFAYGDVNVNASRVFTLGGGNIAIWSSDGNIDAGRGAKTAISAPPPTITVSQSGAISINFGAAVAGSGIRTIQTNPDQPTGNVDLDAPNGNVNAGDAGIGASGNLNVAAQTVAGLDNIQVGGTSTGVPPAVSGVGVSLSAASAAATSATAAATTSVQTNAESQASAVPLSESALGWLEVFVTGLGEEGCRQDDIECLKRQARP
jgi:hypothetical protein